MNNLLLVVMWRHLQTNLFFVYRRLLHTNTLCQAAVNVSIAEDGKKLQLVIEGEPERRYHSIWLRHNCQCPQCFSHDVHMSQVHPNELSTDIKVESVELKDDILHVKWTSSQVNNHTGYFPLQWLKDKDYSNYSSRWNQHRKNIEPLVTTTLPITDYLDLISSDEGTYNWLKQINYYGLSLVKNASTDEQNLEKVLSKFPHVQPTFYGYTAPLITLPEADSSDLGYGTGSLHFHQDLLFYESPPGILLFHCIRNDPYIEGGESILVDCYPVVKEMREKYPKHFDTLTKVPVTFQRYYRGKVKEHRADMRVGRPHIQLDRFGEIAAINWNTHHSEPLCTSEDEVEGYYSAFLCLAKLFNESSYRIQHRLSPGEILCINNRRVLHSRNGFKLNGGVRHFNSVYINIDYLRSQFLVLGSVLNKKEESKNIFSYNV